MADKEGYVGLGLDCANICTALDRGTNGKKMDDLGQSVREAINQLTTWVKPMVRTQSGLLIGNALYCRMVADIQEGVTKQSQCGRASRFLHAKSDKEKIASWKAELNKILHVFQVRFVASPPTLLIARFQTELAINTHVVLSDTKNTVADTHDAVIDTRNTVNNTHNIVSDIHRAVTKSQEGSNAGDRPVSAHRASFIVEHPTDHHCLDSDKVCNFNY